MINRLKIAWLFLITAYYSFIGIAISPFDRNGRIFHKFARIWSNRLLRQTGITLTVEGLENITRNQSYVYVSNHASLFDIPVLIAGIHDDIRIMYKRELRRIPVFGWLLTLSPFIPVDRTNPKDAMASLRKAIGMIKNGSSVVIFPEGTRSRDGQLGTFKRGAFMLAAHAQKPVVPVTIIGTNQILPSHTAHITPGMVHLVIGTPLHNPEPSVKEEKELMNKVHGIIAETLQKNL